MSSRRRLPKVINSPAARHDGKMAEERREKSAAQLAMSVPTPTAPKTDLAPKPEPKVTQKDAPTKPKKSNAAEPAPHKEVKKPSSQAGTEAGIQRTVRVPIDDGARAKIKALSEKLEKPIDYIETGLLKKALAAAKERLKSGKVSAIESDTNLLHTAHTQAKYPTTAAKLVLTAGDEQTLREIFDDPLEVITINSMAGALIGAELKRIINKV